MKILSTAEFTAARTDVYGAAQTGTSAKLAIRTVSETLPAAKAADPAIAPASLAPDTVPGSIASTATITLGSSVDVSIDTLGDHDFYGVTLTAGVTYTIHTSGIYGNNPDTFIFLRDATGAAVASDDDSGPGTYSLINYTPTTTGTFFIDAGTYNDESIGSYHLSIAPVLAAGPDSVGDTTATAAGIALNGSVNGRLDAAGDHDFYAITLTAGQTYLFSTAGTSSSTTTDTILTVRDASGAALAANDDAADAFSAVRYTATTTGTYYLDVSGFSSTTGDFNLTAFTTVLPPVYNFDQIADQLTDGYWGGSERHFNVTTGGALTFNVQALTAPGQTLARAALALWADATGIAFNEVTVGGQLVYDDNQTGAFASSVVSGGIISSSAINVSTQWLTTYGTGFNSYSFQTYIHETGHALGLGHAGNYNGSASYATDALYLNDSWITTIMSYFDQQESSYFADLGFTREFVLTPMIGDVLAIQNLYGTPTTTRTGDTTYGFHNTSGQTVYDATAFPTVAYTIVDNGGIDTLDYSGFGQNQLIDLGQETFSNIGTRVGNVSIARGTVIENAIGGSGNDIIYGNAAANRLTGGAGNDRLYGYGGIDILITGAGTDIVYGGSEDDGIYFGADLDASDFVDGGSGTLDQVGLQGNYTLTLGNDNLINIENLVLLSGSNTSFGASGAERFSYTITSVDANVAAGQTLYVSANTLLATENFTFNGSAETDGSFITFGSEGTDTATGGWMNDGFYFGGSRWSAVDQVNGGAGTLDQLGLQGNYTGAGAIVFGATQLTSIENLVLLSGTDARFGGQGAGFSYDITLNDGNVTAGTFFAVSSNTLGVTESLTLNATGETDAAITVYSGAGNDVLLLGALGDTVYGAAGADRIIGRGGADTLYGGLGNDTFVYSTASDSTTGARDHIRDFATGDLIDVSAIDANSLSGGVQSFSFIGSGNFSAAGQLRATNTGGNDWLVEGDINADGFADLAILVTSDHALTGADFMLNSPPPQEALSKYWLVAEIADSGDVGFALANWYAEIGLGQSHDALASHDFV